jgi:hypothetical protein
MCNGLPLPPEVQAVVKTLEYIRDTPWAQFLNPLARIYAVSRDALAALPGSVTDAQAEDAATR